jgi:hypothetical protein
LNTGEWVAYHATTEQLCTAVEAIRARGLVLAVETVPESWKPELTVLDPTLDQTSNLSAYNTAVGGKSLDVVTTWAPSWYRDSKPTSTFVLVHAPGIPGQDVRPAPST